MWIIYDSEGTPIGTLNADGFYHTIVPELLEGEGCCVLLPINKLNDDEIEKIVEERV